MLFIDDNGKRRSIPFYPEQVPDYMEGAEWSDEVRAIDERNASERARIQADARRRGWRSL